MHIKRSDLNCKQWGSIMWEAVVSFMGDPLNKGEDVAREGIVIEVCCSFHSSTDCILKHYLARQHHLCNPSLKLISSHIQRPILSWSTNLHNHSRLSSIDLKIEFYRLSTSYRNKEKIKFHQYLSYKMANQSPVLTTPPQTPIFYPAVYAVLSKVPIPELLHAQSSQP